MPDYHHTLRNVLIALLLPTIVVGAAGSEGPDPAGHTLEVIRDCMAKSPAPWPDEWNQEYVETIGSAVQSHGDAPHYAVRLGGSLKAAGFADGGQKPSPTRPTSLRGALRLRLPPFLSQSISSRVMRYYSFGPPFWT